MASLSKTTSDHEEIRRWAEERGGKPSHVASTGSKDDIGILRLDFPGFSGQGSLEEITWDQFFEKFDERGLSLIFREETAAGERSNFNKIVSAATAEENESKSGGKRSGRSASKKSSEKAASSKKAASTKKVAAKKTVAKKTSAKKSASGRGFASKKSSSSSKRGSAKKVAAKKAPAKKAAKKKSAAKKRR